MDIVLGRAVSRGAWRRVFLACGIASSLLYGAMIWAIRYEGYSLISQVPSELTAIGAPTQRLWMLLGPIYTVLVIAFGWGVWQSAGRNRHLRIVGGLILAFGSLGLLWPFAPMHQREVLAAGGGTASDTMHVVLGGVTVLFMFLAIGFGAAAFGRRFRMYSLVSVVVLLAFGTLTFLEAPRLQANVPTPWIGLWERINISVFLLWVVVLATVLLRGRAGRSSAAEHEASVSTSHSVRSRDGTRIGYLSVGGGPSVVVIPGVLSMAADYAAFASALSEHFTVHTIERRGRGESGPQGDDYSIVKECEDVLALQVKTGASLLVGHSYGGLVALEVARKNPAFTRIAVYEPGVSIDGSMPTQWMPGYERKLAGNKRVDALVEFTLADAPPRIQKTPAWLMKLILLVLVSCSRQYRQMLGLLHQNLREWREIASLDSSYERYRDIAAGVLLMYGGKSDSAAVTLAMERLAAILPHPETKGFPRLDHFGIERTAPREVATAVSDYFLKQQPRTRRGATTLRVAAAEVAVEKGSG